ncbi:MAG: sulfatase [Anaerolineae bacterium]|nr:sulfatase [Anaerolineae bacterium]
MTNQPNFVFILIDDMGWKDLGIYGSDFYETPNIDQLAREGMVFTNAYAACPVCSPTRASILSGQYPARLGLTNYIGGDEHPTCGKLIDAPYIRELPTTVTSLASTLRDVNYQTWHVGKWHLGNRETYPDRHGFDVNIGGCHYGHPLHGYFSPYAISTLPDGPQGEFLTDRLTREATQLIRQRDKNRPFFLNLWYYTVHNPIQAPTEYIHYFEDKARYLGIDKVNPFQLGETFPSTPKKGKRILRRVLQSNPIYAAMIYALDQNIGHLMHTIKQEFLDETTLVIFTSDNGGLATSEGSPTSNLPLSEGKGWLYEGGTREPLIARWHSVIHPGTHSDTVITSPDFFPTLTELARAKMPDNQACDGISFTSTLVGSKPIHRDAIFWHYPHYGNQGGTPGAAVLSDGWKLIRLFETGKQELYYLPDDISEEHNLINSQPQIAAKLTDKLNGWLSEMEALMPVENPEHNNKPEVRGYRERVLLEKYDLETPLGICMYDEEFRQLFHQYDLDGELIQDPNYLAAHLDDPVTITTDKLTIPRWQVNDLIMNRNDPQTSEESGSH